MNFQKMMARSPKNNDADFFRTPRDATVALMENETFPWSVIEPACGDGAMAEVLKKYGYTVQSSDLYDRGYGVTGVDWLTEIPLSWIPMREYGVITNPPFRHAEDFVWRCNEMGATKYAMLLRLMFLESKKRVELFKTLPLKAVYVFSYRLAFTTPKDGNKKPGGMTPYAWFVWDTEWEGEPAIRWLEDIYKEDK